jgi:outer membrane protein assembly factor BamB
MKPKSSNCRETCGRWSLFRDLPVVLVVLASSLGISQVTSAQETAAQPVSVNTDWTQWRGPDRTSQLKSDILANQANLDNLERKWRVEVEESYSGPIVVGKKVFVTETKDRKFEVVRCLDRETGKQIWEAQWEGAMKVPFFAAANGNWIRSTPTYNDGLLFVCGMRDVLVCLNAETGEQVWKINFPEQYETKLPDFGYVSSPLVDGEDLYTQAGSAVFKLNKRTGELKWRGMQGAENMMSGGAFSSPIIANLHGVRQIVVQSREELAGLNMETGDVLWRQSVPNFRGMNILTPLVIGNRIFTSTYQGGTFLYDIKKDGDKWSAQQLWKQPTQGYMSSPVVIGNHVYLHLRNQRFTCIDLETGKSTWISEPFGQYWSMVAAGDRILALDEQGDLLLIKATPEKFELLGKQHLSDETTWAHVGFVDREVFVRELNAMSVYILSAPKAQ